MGRGIGQQNKYPEVYLGDPEIDFAMLAKSQGINGAKVTAPQDLERALRRAAEVIAGGEPYVLDVRVSPVGPGADSTWHQKFKLRSWFDGWLGRLSAALSHRERAGSEVGVL